MRNLKKFLALVLAMMMVFSLMVTANASTNTFTDAGEVSADYKTAADVLTALGVLKGYDDGSFKPEATITRTEYATILYRIHSGDVNDEKVADYAKYADFSDITKGAWYEGAVGYVQHEGLMKGIDDNNKIFGKGNITVVDATVSLLRALGFDQNGEYEGADYKTKAIIDASAANNDDASNGVRILSTAEVRAARQDATRQIIADLAFKTLQAPKVVYNKIAEEYEGTGSYSLGVEALGIEELTGPKAIEAAEPNYFGRPNVTKVWVIGDDVFTVGAPEPAVVFNTKQTANSVAAELKAAGITGVDAGGNGALDVALYYNGNSSTATCKYADALSKAKTPDGLQTVLTSLTGANNTRVEVYDVDGNGKADRVVAINTFSYVLTEDDIVEAKDDDPAYITISDYDLDDHGSWEGQHYQWATANSKDCYTYKTDEFEAGDVILYTRGQDPNGTGTAPVIVDVWKAEPVLGTMTKINTNNGESYVINGETYVMSDGTVGVCATGTTPTTAPATADLGREYTYYIGLNKGIVYIDKSNDPTANSTDYAIVVGASAALDPLSDEGATCRVKILTNNGETAIYDLDGVFNVGSSNATYNGMVNDGSPDQNPTANDYLVQVGTDKYVKVASETDAESGDLSPRFVDIYKYSVEDGVVTLRALTATGTADKGVDPVLQGVTSTDPITKTSKTVSLADNKTAGAPIIIDSKTVFVLKDRIVTGAANLGSTSIAAGAQVVLAVSGNKSDTTETVYTVKYVFANEIAYGGAAATADYVYIDHSKYTEEKVDGKSVYTYKGIPSDGGDPIELTTDASNKLTDSGIYTYNDDFTVKKADASTGNKVKKAEYSGGWTAAGYFVGKVTAIGDGTIQIDVTDPTATKLYFSYTVGSEVIIKSGAKLVVGAEVTAVFTNDNSDPVITALFVTDKPAS